MAKWVEINGSPNYRKGPGSARTLTRMFHADVGQGLAQAGAHGYILDSLLDYDGTRLFLASINPYNDEGRDLVQISWENFGSNAGSTIPDQAYNGGVRRYHGEEEWSWASGLDTETITPETRALKGGSMASSWLLNSGYALGDSLLVPGLFLVWKRWFRTGLAHPVSDLLTSHTLPRTKTAALASISAYLPDGAGVYEPGIAGPKIGKILGSSGLERRFLCSDISIEADGDLVCRTAQFKYTRDPDGWMCPPYAD